MAIEDREKLEWADVLLRLRDTSWWTLRFTSSCPLCFSFSATPFPPHTRFPPPQSRSLSYPRKICVCTEDTPEIIEDIKLSGTENNDTGIRLYKYHLFLLLSHLSDALFLISFLDLFLFPSLLVFSFSASLFLSFSSTKLFLTSFTTCVFFHTYLANNHNDPHFSSPTTTTIFIPKEKLFSIVLVIKNNSPHCLLTNISIRPLISCILYEILMKKFSDMAIYGLYLYKILYVHK